MSKERKVTEKKIPPQKTLVKVIEGIWESLESHLDATIPQKVKYKCPHCGGRNFHRQVAIEYAQMILDLTKLL